MLSEVALAISPDGSRIAANQTLDRRMLELSESAGTVIWDTSSGTILHRFDNLARGALAWHPTADLLAVGGGYSISITDISGNVVWTLEGHAEEKDPRSLIRDLAFSPDGGTLASLSTDGTVRLWSVDTGACEPGKVLKLRRMQPQSLSFSPDGATLAICGPGRDPELWDPSAGRRISRIKGLDAAACSVAYASDGDLLIGTGDLEESDPTEPAGLHVMDPSGQLTAGPQAPGSDIEWMTVSPSGRLVAYATEAANRQVIVWDRSTDTQQKPPRTGGSTGRLLWAPDESVLYAASRHNPVLAWSGDDWQEFEVP